MSFDDDEQIVILKDAPSGKKAPTFVAGKIKIEVINLIEAPLEETRFKVLLELTESGDIEGRHGIDLVMVIDTSGSMQEGGKLDKLKIATQFIVEKLSPVDRFSVVTFFDSSERLFPLRQITEDSKAEIIEEIKLLRAKKTKKNIAKGLRMALKVLNDRHFKDGRVSAIMLFSDDAEYRGKVAEVDVSMVPVHTFGFGASHDQRVLEEIAKKSNGGTFSDVQNENNLIIALSQCLAGLLTVVVWDLRLKVAPVKTESIIKKVLVGNYPTETENSAVTISYGDLYGKEVRKVLVILSLPNIVESDPRAKDVLRITCSYSDGHGKERFEAHPILITVIRTGPKEIRLKKAEEKRVEPKMLQEKTKMDERKKDDKKSDKKRKMKMPAGAEFRIYLAERMEREREREREREKERKRERENQPSTSYVNVSRVIEDEERLLDELDAVLQESEEPERSVPPKEGKKTKTVIQRVPEIMRQSRQCFEPTQLSIGPIYAANEKLFKQNLKIKLAAHFIDRSGRKRDILLGEIKEKAEEIKKYFHRDVIEEYTDEELIRLVFLDGCAMLGFIDTYVNQKLHVFEFSQCEPEFIQRDLFLLENQIPFIVLETLMGFETELGKGDLVDDFCRFIALMGNNQGEFTKFLVLDSVHKHPLHILDLLREVILLDNPNSCFHQNECMPTYLIRRIFSLLCYCACGVVAFISRILKRFNKPESLPEYWSKITQNSFPNVQELKKSGIEFKPSDSLTTISFRSSFFTTAQLKLPRLVVDVLTVDMLYNLAAYEMCLSESHPNKNPWFISYINLLDLLVDDEHDVKDLKAADILPKLYISDDKVADLINGMGSELLPPVIDTYAHVKKKIEKHCRSRSRRRCALWIAQVYYSHFKSPWTILALFAAIVILALTFVQTWYAVNPKH